MGSILVTDSQDIDSVYQSLILSFKAQSVRRDMIGAIACDCDTEYTNVAWCYTSTPNDDTQWYHISVFAPTATVRKFGDFNYVIDIDGIISLVMGSQTYITVNPHIGEFTCHLGDIHFAYTYNTQSDIKTVLTYAVYMRDRLIIHYDFDEMPLRWHCPKYALKKIAKWLE